MAIVTRSDIGKCLHRPAISPNGRILAVVAPDPRIHLLDLTDAVHGDNAITRLRLPPNAKAFLQDCHIIRWSPEFMLDDDADSTTTSEADLGTTWLLLSDGKRVIAMSTDIRLPRMMPGVDGDTGSKSNILADYDLGGQFGNLTLLEFVFDHRHALLMYEHGGSATLLSLTRPQREEISNVKHTGSTAFAQAPDANRFALLRRDEGQDKISVFELSSNSVPVQHAFEPRTSDAQGVMWCPAGQPILAVYDAPSYGLNVTFYTAQGHALKQLDIGSTNMNLVRQPLSVKGIGTTCLRWTNTVSGQTIQAILDGQKQVFVRYLAKASVAAQEVALFVHPDTVDGANAFVWQEEMEKSIPSSNASTFLSQKASFSTSSIPTDPNSPSTDAIEINADQTMIATCLKSCIIIFRYPIKNVLWHPVLPHVLVIITHQRRPIVYAWYQENLGPISGEIVLNHEMHTNPLMSTLSAKFAASWLPSATHTDGRVPFFFTSATRFEVSFLQNVNGKVKFGSALRQDGDAFANGKISGTDESIIIDTPSKAAKPYKSARFSVEERSGLDGDGFLYAQAKQREW